MSSHRPTKQVEVRFIGRPPLRNLNRAPGVSQVELLDETTVRCTVSGSFQQFLEALRGYEVISLESTSAPPADLEGEE